MRGWVLALIAVLVMSGCAAPPSGPAAKSDEIESTWSDGAKNETGAPDLPNNQTVEWGTLEVDREGLGGWMFFHQAFHRPVSEVRYSYNLQLAVHGNGTGAPWLLYQVPALVANDQNQQRILFRGFEYRTGIAGQTITVQQEVVGGAGTSASFDGVVFGFMASGPWTLALNYSTGDGDVIEPTNLAHGRTVARTFGARSIAPNGPAGHIQLDSKVSVAGWTHLQIAFDPLQPNGVRSYDLNIPGGHRANGIATARGYDTPVVGGAGYSRVDFLGRFDGPPGDVKAEVAYAETDLSLDVILFHAPFDPADPWSDLAFGPYSGASSPFRDWSI